MVLVAHVVCEAIADNTMHAHLPVHGRPHVMSSLMHFHIVLVQMSRERDA